MTTVNLTFPQAYGLGFADYIRRIKPISVWVDDQEPKIKWSQSRVMGCDDMEWSFEFQNVGQAVMFKLLWGGR